MKLYTNGSFLYTRNWQLAQKSCKPRDKENTKYKINVTLSKKLQQQQLTENPKKNERKREKTIWTIINFETKRKINDQRSVVIVGCLQEIY